MNPEWTVPTGEVSEGRHARSPLDNNGPKVESPPVSPAVPLLEPLPVPPAKAVTFLAGAGVAEELAVLLAAAAAGAGAG